jgi:hypothetical protein
VLTDEWAEEQQVLEQQWDDSIKGDNMEALQKVRRHMHVSIRNMSEHSTLLYYTTRQSTIWIRKDKKKEPIILHVV